MQAEDIDLAIYDRGSRIVPLTIFVILVGLVVWLFLPTPDTSKLISVQFCKSHQLIRENLVVEYRITGKGNSYLNTIINKGEKCSGKINLSRPYEQDIVQLTIRTEEDIYPIPKLQFLVFNHGKLYPVHTADLDQKQRNLIVFSLKKSNAKLIELD